jgi:hypothetical protein
VWVSWMGRRLGHIVTFAKLRVNQSFTPSDQKRISFAEQEQVTCLRCDWLVHQRRPKFHCVPASQQRTQMAQSVISLHRNASDAVGATTDIGRPGG